VVSGRRHAPAALPPVGPGTRCIGSWVGPRVGLDGAENLAPTGIWSPDRPALASYYTRTDYTIPTVTKVNVKIIISSLDSEDPEPRTSHYKPTV
jgi:hypothetical protein